MFNETLLFFSIFAALLVYIIDYGFGNPGGDNWNDSELLSQYSFLMAKFKLKRIGAWEKLEKQLDDQQRAAQSQKELLEIDKSFRKIVFSTAQPLFTWEKAAGMCPICFHFWASFFIFVLVNIFVLKESIIIFTLYMLISHFFIRLLKKYF